MNEQSKRARGTPFGVAEESPFIAISSSSVYGSAKGDAVWRSIGEVDMDGTPDGEVESVGDKLGLNTSHSSLFINSKLPQSMGPVKEGLPPA